MMRLLQRSGAVAAIAALVACGGAGGGSISGIVPAASSPNTQPSTNPPTAQANNVKLTMQISGAAKATIARAEAAEVRNGVRPQYVSPSSAGARIVVYPHGSTTAIATYVYDVSSGSPSCSSGSPRTCSLALTLQPATYDFNVAIYDQAPVSGAIPSSAKQLGIASLTQTIAPYVANTMQVYVEGVVASLSGGPGFVTVPAGAGARTVGIAIVADDADGNPITTDGNHPYANPITVTLSEVGGSGLSYLALNGTNVGTTATVTQAGQSLTLNYNGGGSAGYSTLTSLAASGAATQSVRVSPMYVTGSAAATDANQTNSVTISEYGAPSNVVTTPGWSCAGFSAAAGAGVVNLTSPPATYDAALLPNYSCTAIPIQDAYGTTVSVPVSATIPVVPTCASATATTLYIGGGKVGGSWPTTNGSYCAPNAPTSINIYAPPNNSTHLGSASGAVSELNDTTAPTITNTCGGKAAVTSPTTPASSLYQPLSGTVAATSVVNGIAAVQTCSVTFNDGSPNNPAQVIPVNITPTLYALSIGSSSTQSSCHQNYIGTRPQYTCVGYTSVDLGAGGPNSGYTFALPTNALAINVNMSVSSGTPYLFLYQGASAWQVASGSTYNATITVPNGAGTYGLRLETETVCSLLGSPCTPPVPSMTANGSAVTATNGTGTTTPPVASAQTFF